MKKLVFGFLLFSSWLLQAAAPAASAGEDTKAAKKSNLETSHVHHFAADLLGDNNLENIKASQSGVRDVILSPWVNRYLQYLLKGTEDVSYLITPRTELQGLADLSLTVHDIQRIQELVLAVLIGHGSSIQMALPILPEWLARDYVNLTDILMKSGVQQGYWRAGLGDRKYHTGIIQHILYKLCREKKFKYTYVHEKLYEQLGDAKGANATQLATNEINRIKNTVDLELIKYQSIEEVEDQAVAEGVTHLIVPASEVYKAIHPNQQGPVNQALINELNKILFKNPELTVVLAFNDDATEISRTFRLLTEVKKMVITGSSLQKIEISFLGQSKNLEILELSYGIKSIADNFLFECKNLISLRLSLALETVGDHFLEGCDRLQELELSHGLKKAGNNFLLYCISLQKLNMPYEFISAQDNFLQGCKKLRNLRWPHSFIEVGDKCCEECLILEHVQISPNFKKAGNRFFVNCKKLKHIELSDVLIEAKDGFLAGCRSLKTLRLPRHLKKVGNGFLEWCANLISLELPKGLILVGNDFLKNCTGLQILTIWQGLDDALNNRMLRELNKQVFHQETKYFNPVNYPNLKPENIIVIPQN